jgi:hypothetical protein
VSGHAYRGSAVMDAETTVAPRVASPSWEEDLLLVAVFAVVGVLGIGAGIAGDCQVQTSMGLLLVGFAAKVLVDIVRQRSAALGRSP